MYSMKLIISNFNTYDLIPFKILVIELSTYNKHTWIFVIVYISAVDWLTYLPWGGTRRREAWCIDELFLWSFSPFFSSGHMLEDLFRQFSFLHSVYMVFPFFFFSMIGVTLKSDIMFSSVDPLRVISSVLLINFISTAVIFLLSDFFSAYTSQPFVTIGTECVLYPFNLASFRNLLFMRVLFMSPMTLRNFAILLSIYTSLYDISFPRYLNMLPCSHLWLFYFLWYLFL